MQDNNPNQLSGWIKLYTPQGALVTISIPYDQPITAEQAVMMLYSANILLDAGFLVNAPGLEEGEQVEEINCVSRREAKDSTAIIDFYSSNPKLLKKFMHVYLNTEQDIKDFEEVAGVVVASIPVYDGQNAIARDDTKAGKYLVYLPHPIQLVWMISAKWEEWKAAGGEGQEPHKRLLVRYLTEAKAPAPGNQPAATQTQPPLASEPPAAPQPAVPRCEACGQALPRHAPGCAIFKALIAGYKYADNRAVNGNANERAAYDAYVKVENAIPTSRDSLRDWYASHKLSK